MRNVATEIPHKSCIGCASCSLRCPRLIIRMTEDHEGFLFPSISKEEDCISCGICLKHCPAHQTLIPHRKEFGSYIARWKNAKEIANSASGGAFYGLSKLLFKKYGTVTIFGAAYDKENIIVKHVPIRTAKGLTTLQGSKYVQSLLGFTYLDVYKELKQDRYVVFVGTPCQCYGLKRFLRREYENLFLIDIICHGVPSPKYLQRIITLSMGNSIKGTTIKFRHKPKFGVGKSKFATLMKKSGRYLLSRPEEDPYLSTFLQCLNFRECCYQCSFARRDRISDITIGDCDSQDEYEKFKEYSNSTIITNTEKGENLWKYAKPYFFGTD